MPYAIAMGQIKMTTTTVTFSSGVVMLNLSESPLNGWNQSCDEQNRNAS